MDSIFCMLSAEGGDRMTTWYDAENHLNVVFTDFPQGVDEFVTENADGSYTAFIGQNRCPQKIKEAYRHALVHIKSHDLEDGVDVQEAERRTHALSELDRHGVKAVREETEAVVREEVCRLEN